MADEKSPKKEFTPKQDTFCREYLKDLNATQAAIRAGYSAATARQIASTLLSNINIQDRIQVLMEERAKRTAITADYVLTTIRDTVERCRQAEPVEEWDADAKCMMPTGEWQFQHQGVLKGCELLGKHLKLFTEKHEHTGADGKPIEYRDLSRLPDDEIEKQLAALLAKQKAPKAE